MSSKRKSAAARFRALIEETQRLTRADAGANGADTAYTALAHWQCERLGMTYTDFHGHKRYKAALDFFLTDIYGPKDFSQRDNDIERVYPIMVKVLSVPAIESLTQALELHTLSMGLDRQLIDVLTGELGVELGPDAHTLTPELYAEGYRLCDNYDERQRQIQLAIDSALALEAAVKRRMLYATVKVARGPAKAAGFGELQSFLERGLAAFKKMKGSHRFLDALAAREQHVLEALFDDAPADTWYGDVLSHIVAP